MIHLTTGRTMNHAITDWPDLPYPAWRDTAVTLQLWTQIVGKVRLSLTPWLNHGWQVTLYVTARGLGTSPIPFGHEILEIEFDFIDHRLKARTSRGEEGSFALEPQTVAAFYRRVMDLLAGLGVAVSINEMPNEMPDAIPFSQDKTHSAYDAAASNHFWRALVQVDRVFKLFRSSFLGKASPVHFFWGSFDLAVTRFSGRMAPLHPGGVSGLPDDVTREAYSHEVSSAGFWPGSDAFPQAAFYSYAYPEPQGFRDRPVTPGASFDTKLGEFILPYDVVRNAASPDNVLLDFLTQTYTAAAETGHWDRAALECALGVPAQPRTLSSARG
ncbi:DUF5996 family protein [Microvirga sp. 2MCAF38]|uniref:DUF5996 family protein n=1 Tax=Microvirga sp. 2MCAF38 TaxID=3232989 RepID=UPI003F94BB4E